MNADVVRADERGLQDEEDDPAGKDCSVKIEYPGANGRGVDEVVVDGVAEAVDHNYCDEERHAEVEVLREKRSLPDCHGGPDGRSGH